MEALETPRALTGTQISPVFYAFGAHFRSVRLAAYGTEGWWFEPTGVYFTGQGLTTTLVLSVTRFSDSLSEMLR